MRLVRFFVALALVVASVAAFGATADAAGKAPQGKGLYFLIADDYHFTNLVCDGGITDFLLTRGGNAGWVVEAGNPDQMYVLASISFDGTEYPEVGDPEPFVFSQTFGRRVGKAASTIECTADFYHEHPGWGSAEADAEFTLVRIW